jgi:UDP-glucose 4-epimerase
MKKILMIGGAGFIGSNLVRQFLKDDNFEIFVIEPEKADIERLNEVKSQITIIRADLKDILYLNKIISENNIEVVVHLVSTLLPKSTLEDYQNEMNDLILPTMNIMHICSRLDILFVYMSSGGAVYGNGSSAVFKETDRLEPISYYGQSKCFMEETIKFENRSSGLRYLILRPSNPYGHGQNLYGRQGLIAVSIGKILKNEPITIWGDGSLIRDYIHIDDLCECIYKLIVTDVKNEIINIGSGEGHSIKSIIDMLADIVEKPIDIKYLESRNVDVNSVILSIDHLQSFLPIKTDNDIRKGIYIFYNTELKKKLQGM